MNFLGKYVITSIGVLVISVFSSLVSYAEVPDIGLVHQDNSSDFLSINDNSDDYNFFDILLDYIDDIHDSAENLTEDNSDIVIEHPKEPVYPTKKVYSVKEGMPKNTRHINEGYWIGSMPSLDNIDAMYNHGIRVILTVAKPKPSWESVKKRINFLGIEHIYLPIGSRFPRSDSFYSILSSYNPNEIYIHCEHGSDRSGTFIAYLLIRKFHWAPQRALLAMLNPSRTDLRGLQQVLTKYGILITKEDLEIMGVYSGNSGLKARNDDYRRLISTMLDVVIELPSI